MKHNNNSGRTCDRQRNIDITIGRNIRTRRVVHGWTQTDVGAKLGVSYQQVQKYETGRDALRPARLKQLAELFDCSIYDLFYDWEVLGGAPPVTTPGRLETARITALIRCFLRIRSPKSRSTPTPSCAPSPASSRTTSSPSARSSAKIEWRGKHFGAIMQRITGSVCADSDGTITVSLSLPP